MKLLSLVGLLAFVALAGCAHSPPIAEMQNDPRCHVWARGGLGNLASVVENGQASLYGLGGGVKKGPRFSSDTDIEWPGSWGKKRIGTYVDHYLTIHGMWSDLGPTLIGPHEAVVQGLMSSLKMEYNERCTDRDAALGVLAITVVVASQH
jgi:hypothetical protein